MNDTFLLLAVYRFNNTRFIPYNTCIAFLWLRSNLQPSALMVITTRTEQGSEVLLMKMSEMHMDDGIWLGKKKHRWICANGINEHTSRMFNIWLLSGTFSNHFTSVLLLQMSQLNWIIKSLIWNMTIRIQSNVGTFNNTKHVSKINHKINKVYL